MQGVAISSYQGGHVEYFAYLVELLRERGAGHVQVYGGGGGVIVAERDRASCTRTASRGSSPPRTASDSAWPGMVNTIMPECDVDLGRRSPPDLLDRRAAPATPARAGPRHHRRSRPARCPTPSWPQRAAARTAPAPVLGITGTGGSGKSSLTDELVRRFRLDQEDKLRVAVLAVDPTRRKGGGALLGDRIRMNASTADRVFFRSLATRGARAAAARAPRRRHRRLQGRRLRPRHRRDARHRPGRRRRSSTVRRRLAVRHDARVRRRLAAGEDRHARLRRRRRHQQVRAPRRRGRPARRGPPAGAQPRGVRRRRGRTCRSSAPVAATLQRRRRHRALPAPARPARRARACRSATGVLAPGRRPGLDRARQPSSRPPGRATSPRSPRRSAATTRATDRAGRRCARRRQHLRTGRASWSATRADDAAARLAEEAAAELARRAPSALDGVAADRRGLLRRRARRARPRQGAAHRRCPATTLSGTPVPRVALPRYADDGELLRFLRAENLPGHFPFTAGVFPFKREGEDPARMFAGEGDAVPHQPPLPPALRGPAGHPAVDRVRLGDPLRPRPGRAPRHLRQGRHLRGLDRDARRHEGAVRRLRPVRADDVGVDDHQRPGADDPGDVPQHRDRPAARRRSAERRGPRADAGRGARRSGAYALRTVRGTVQADILKEDQGQNTCIFSTEFALADDGRHPGVVHRSTRCATSTRCRSPATTSPRPGRTRSASSPSRWPTASPTSSPTSPAAWRSTTSRRTCRSSSPTAWTPSTPCSAGWPGGSGRSRCATATAANERAQKLKYHVQTSGRSLHAQEMDFNDIRTTLQALCAIYDNANSLHTNAYDEAVTTPTAESVRRALAIQLIINQEWGLSMNENPLQGSFVVDELTDLVEEAVLAEFDRITERGGVLGAMETGYQRGRIQDESMLYEQRKHDGTLPIVGVNTFLATRHATEAHRDARAGPRHRGGEAARSSTGSRDFQAAHADEAAGRAAPGCRTRRPTGEQRVRRADGRRPGLLAGPDHRGVLRGRRPVPPQRVRRPADDLGIPGASCRGRRGGWSRWCPSLTEALAVTRPPGCRRRHRLVHPSRRPRRARVRGTKNPDRAPRSPRWRPTWSSPTRRRTGARRRRLRAAGVPVWVTVIERSTRRFGSLRRLFAALRVARPDWLRRRPSAPGPPAPSRGAHAGCRARSGGIRGWWSARAPSPATCWPGSALDNVFADTPTAIRTSSPASSRAARTSSAARRALPLHRRRRPGGLPRRAVRARHRPAPHLVRAEPDRGCPGAACPAGSSGPGRRVSDNRRRAPRGLGIWRP